MLNFTLFSQKYILQMLILHCLLIIILKVKHMLLK